MILSITKNNKIKVSIVFLVSYIFLFFLNAFFPTQSDDIGYKIGGINAAINSYMNWNGRLGEMFRLAFGGWFAATPFYPIINAFAGTLLLFLIFYIFFQKLPETLIEISIYCIILLFYMVDPVFSFGSVFYWAAGVYNYLYTWIWTFLWLIPYVFYWNKKSDKYDNIKWQVISIISGFLAGWSSELCIVFIVLCIFSIIYALSKKIKLPYWYYIGLVSLTIGWIILYTCPGTNKRASDFDGYLSLIDIIKLGPIGIYNRLIYCFSITKAYLFYENFLLISLFILLTVFTNKRNMKQKIIAFLSILILLIPLRIIPKLYFIPFAILICIYNAKIDKENKKYFYIIAATLFVEFIFIGATIQVYIPKRASFQYTLLNTILIIINMMYFYNAIQNRNKLLIFISSSSILITILFSIFVITDATIMNKKWKKMEASINKQKSEGISNIMVDKDTFISKFWSYGDWGNPTEDTEDWVNKSYSNYYGVETIVVK